MTKQEFDALVQRSVVEEDLTEIADIGMALPVGEMDREQSQLPADCRTKVLYPALP